MDGDQRGQRSLIWAGDLDPRDASSEAERGARVTEDTWSIGHKTEAEVAHDKRRNTVEGVSKDR